MVQKIKNLLSADDVQQLLTYYSIDDDRTDDRPDVRSKHPRWDQDSWPQHIVKKCLDSILPDPYIVEEVIFNESKTTAFRLHVDSGNGNASKMYKAVLIPLLIERDSHTVFFNNFWPGTSTKFSRDDISPFRYNLVNKYQQVCEVADIRTLLEDCQSRPEVVQDFDVTDDFISSLVELVAKRSGVTGLSHTDNRTSDYSRLTNYLPNAEFDPAIKDQYLKHISLQSLAGLTLDCVVPWVPGDAILFDRRQLHCASHCHSRKIGITVFTQHQ